MAGVGDVAVGSLLVDPIANAAGGSSRSGSKSGGNRKSRQADPPGPRHRPNPPEREGLA
eukprot:CAMPEP_0172313400 /NCGR_PEP_ID=MMETSP1058-20130122/20152_1 /TAXON_ID=83371 /ORGANISM="Detonula confervacea, Strain CCMP 353" /LENGTH=58 /DNA_ID=CAMNT_0013027045 /DNA_START=24 /DNA_END=196 /DNA_ORIENTATION=+